MTLVPQIRNLTLGRVEYLAQGHTAMNLEWVLPHFPPGKEVPPRKRLYSVLVDLSQTRLFGNPTDCCQASCPWDFPYKNTGSLPCPLTGIFPTQASKAESLCLLY